MVGPPVCSQKVVNSMLQWNSDFERVFKFIYSNLIDIDHPNKIPDHNQTCNVIFVWKYFFIGWSLVGSGTKHKCLLYFNNQFPFVHQNFVNINLGDSYPTAQAPHSALSYPHKVRTSRHQVQFPMGKKTSSVDITLVPTNLQVKQTREVASYGKDDPTIQLKAITNTHQWLPSSAVAGLISLIISYAVIPLDLLWLIQEYLDWWHSTGALTFLHFNDCLGLYRPLDWIMLVCWLIPYLGGWKLAFLYLASSCEDCWSAPSTAIWIRRHDRL